jgi:hypothetical protein
MHNSYATARKLTGGDDTPKTMPGTWPGIMMRWKCGAGARLAPYAAKRNRQPSNLNETFSLAR